MGKSDRVFAGSDNGKTGALVILDRFGEIIEKNKTPLIKSPKGRSEYDIPGMRDLLKKWKPILRLVTIEKSHPLPPTMGGGVAQFGRGLSFGLWQGLLCGLEIPYIVVSARSWQKTMLADLSKMDRKQASVIAAQRLWPNHDFRRTERCKNPDDGLTDAALIGEHGRRSATANIP